jgi:hypothetical protein
MHIAFAARGQITLKEKNAPLEKILSAIENQTKYVFLYDPDQLKKTTITIDVKNASLRETLTKCFKGLSIEFTVVGNNVLLKRKQINQNKDRKTLKNYDYAASGRDNTQPKWCSNKPFFP